MGVEEIDKSVNTEREQELNDVSAIIATDFGKRFLMRLINRAGIYQPTYASGIHPGDFAFMEGRREFGLFILAEITQANSDEWLSMQKQQFTLNKQLEEKVKHEREQQRASDN